MRAHADPHPARAHQQQRRACARLPRRAPGRVGPGQVQLRRVAAVGARLAQLLRRAEVPDDDGVDYVRAGVREPRHQPDGPDRADAALRRRVALDGGADDRRRAEGRLPARYGGAEPEAVAVLPVPPGLRPLHRVLPQLDGLHEDRAGGSVTLAQGGPYADAKEQLGRYVVIRAPDLDTALDWAARCPAAPQSAVEARPNLPPMH